LVHATQTRVEYLAAQVFRSMVSPLLRVMSAGDLSGQKEGTVAGPPGPQPMMQFKLPSAMASCNSRQFRMNRFA